MTDGMVLTAGSDFNILLGNLITEDLREEEVDADLMLDAANGTAKETGAKEETGIGATVKAETGAKENVNTGTTVFKRRGVSWRLLAITVLAVVSNRIAATVVKKLFMLAMKILLAWRYCGSPLWIL